MVKKTHVLENFDHAKIQRIDLRCNQLSPYLKHSNKTVGDVVKINHDKNMKMKKKHSNHTGGGGRLLE